MSLLEKNDFECIYFRGFYAVSQVHKRAYRQSGEIFCTFEDTHRILRLTISFPYFRSLGRRRQLSTRYQNQSLLLLHRLFAVNSLIKLRVSKNILL